MKTPKLCYLGIAWLSFFHHLKFIFKSLLCKLISWCISLISAFLLSLLSLQMKNDQSFKCLLVFSHIDWALPIRHFLDSCPACLEVHRSSCGLCVQQAHAWVHTCRCMHDCCRVRMEFSGNKLLKTGLWAHGISTSLNLTAKTNRGNCSGLCWISLPPWLCCSFTRKKKLAEVSA